MAGDNGVQESLLCEGIMDAVSKMVYGNPKGLNLKQFGMSLWPAKNEDSARSEFSRAISEQYSNVNLTLEELEKVMDISGNPEVIVNYLCDRFGFDRPHKKNVATFEQGIEAKVGSLQTQLKDVMREIQNLAKLKGPT